jgi:hypothetical protein
MSTLLLGVPVKISSLPLVVLRESDVSVGYFFLRGLFAIIFYFLVPPLAATGLGFATGGGDIGFFGFLGVIGTILLPPV